MIGPAPGNNNYADADEWGPTPETYTGQSVQATGIVTTTDPVVIDVEYGDDRLIEVLVTDVEATVNPEQELAAFGRLSDEQTIEAERTHHRDQWEVYYMSGISFVGGLVVLGRVLRQWVPHRHSRGVVPRGQSKND
jgi:hypothetical protein